MDDFPSRLSKPGLSLIGKLFSDNILHNVTYLFVKRRKNFKVNLRDEDATIVVEVELLPGGGGVPTTRFSGHIPVARPIFNDTFEL